MHISIIRCATVDAVDVVSAGNLANVVRVNVATKILSLKRTRRAQYFPLRTLHRVHWFLHSFPSFSGVFFSPLFFYKPSLSLLTRAHSFFLLDACLLFFTFDKRDINLRKIVERARLIFRTKFPFDSGSMDVGVHVNSRGPALAVQGNSISF